MLVSRDNNFKNETIASIATTNAVTNPVTNSVISAELNTSQLLIKSNPLAATIIGTAKMNVYSAAAVCDTRANKPPLIVEPERENPGQRAKH